MLSFAHLLLGSRGPSTVILMALWYVATCGGFVKTVIVSVKLFPATRKKTITEHMCRENVYSPFQIALKHTKWHLNTLAVHNLRQTCAQKAGYITPQLPGAGCIRFVATTQGFREKKINFYLNDLHFVCKKEVNP